jgi:hypothetical protein
MGGRFRKFHCRNLIRAAESTRCSVWNQFAMERGQMDIKTPSGEPISWAASAPRATAAEGPIRTTDRTRGLMAHVEDNFRIAEYYSGLGIRT